MLRISILLLITTLIGCTTTKPCEVKVKGECREMSPGEKSGPGSRGHEQKPKETL